MGSIASSIVGITLPWCVEELNHGDWALDPTSPVVDLAPDMIEPSGLATTGSCSGAGRRRAHATEQGERDGGGLLPQST